MSESLASNGVKKTAVFSKASTGAYEQVFVPHPGDALRLVALFAIPAAWIASGPLSALAMLLVCGGTWAVRFYSQTRGEDVLGQAVMLFGGTFSVLGTYKIIGWLDLVVHFLMIAILAKLLTNMLLHHGSMPAAGSPREAGGVLVAVTSMGVLLAVLWEIGEWVGHTFINQGVGVGYEDTLGDLAAGLLGATAAAFWFRTSMKRSRRRS